MQFAVFTVFSIAWLSAVTFLALLAWLAIRSKVPGATTAGALKTWHSFYTWPVQLLSRSTWVPQREKAVVRAARLAAIACITCLAATALLFGVVTVQR
jgi:hypothetical protein